MIVERIVCGPLETNCWLVGDDEGGPLVVIDPAGDAEKVAARIAERDVGCVVLTHGHFDHLGAADEIRDLTGAPLLVHEADAAAIVSPEGSGGTLFGFDHRTAAPDRTLADGDRIDSGELTLEVVHTPGHTPGSICLLGEGHLFSGDTLFSGSVGRTDFPGGDARALRRSIGERLTPLPDETVVHPGHGPDTTIARERRVNPFFPRA
ncbi:MAG: MBL fold metallo-hydrolase [Coriobacteriia bacterium]